MRRDLPRVLLEVLGVVEEDGREDVRHAQRVLDAQLRAEEDHGQDARQEDGDGRRVALEHRVGVLEDSTATLDDLREAVATLEDTIRSARRVFGNTNPLAQGMECYLDESRAALRARE